MLSGVRQAPKTIFDAIQAMQKAHADQELRNGDVTLDLIGMEIRSKSSCAWFAREGLNGTWVPERFDHD
jgi:hypothetical protein